MNLVILGTAFAINAMILGIIIKRDRKKLAAKIKCLMRDCGNETITEGEIISWLD